MVEKCQAHVCSPNELLLMYNYMHECISRGCFDFTTTSDYLHCAGLCMPWSYTTYMPKYSGVQLPRLFLFMSLHCSLVKESPACVLYSILDGKGLERGKGPVKFPEFCLFFLSDFIQRNASCGMKPAILFHR
ncbi:hypothetical protein SADUNF_Sadunf06G0206300 [Salix dunnii]|uniref:Uncharacterized protein n=1 Tax=Salix dunnii TaxID=1413687 RepID=A0A835K8F8_9ROSI|nr:hypothetical protein SADUNF_Sadunf06G0206300 [Salix dunnii]